MRLSALIPTLCCVAALILSFLCLFAGHKQSFMEDYHLMTLNTSLLGETLLDTNRSSSNPLLNLLDKIPNQISESINERIGEVTAKIGIQDWYSAHLLNYCDGQYTPVEVANATFPQSLIHKDVKNCSASQAMYKFDPTAILEVALNKTTGKKVTLSDLQWPEDIDNGVKALNTLMGAMFVLYVLAIAFIFLALVASVFAILASGRLSACVNFLIAILAFLAIGLASALVTAVMKKGTELINKYGEDIGVVAYKGGKFLALTWAATALMFIVLCAWVVEICIGRRTKRSERVYAKH